ncbi:MAG: hydrogenase iron-sulfur subunit [Deltaproteobacteria bacterium]|nr:hydrogenase iron-sulfur subunit [Deltaproteobacteria bacterium]
MLQIAFKNGGNDYLMPEVRTMSRKLQIVVLACQQALPEPGRLAATLGNSDFKGRVVAEPCSSKVEVFQMLRILSTEADLLWIIGCPEELCRFTEGSFRMGRRVDYARNYLAEIGLETQRLGMSRIPPGDEQALTEAAAEMQRLARSLGPNPARSGSPGGEGVSKP